MTLIYFILILGITVLVHEFGHFIFAKKFGVYVYEFSIGMGPRIFKFKRKNDETEYSIRLFPIGGYVQMAGEEIEENENIPKEKQLHSKTIFQRFMIMVAGVLMNFLLAIVLLFCIGLFNRVSFDNVYVEDSSIIGLNNGERIVKVNNHFVNNYDKLALEMTIVGDKEFTITTKSSDGVKHDSIVSPVGVGKSGLLYGKEYGFKVEDLTITESSLNALEKGDKILKINGIEVDTYSNLLRAVDNDSFVITVSHNGEINDVTINVTENKNDELVGYNYGFYISGHYEKGFFAALKYAFFKFFSTIEQMIFTLLYLFTGKIKLGMLSGPVGIFNAVSIYSKYGISNLISLLCLICINVGFINILPLPAFDGGHIVFIIIEKIRGKAISPKIQNTIHTVGFILLMLLMIIVTYSDITKLF